MCYTTHKQAHLRKLSCYTRKDSKRAVFGKVGVRLAAICLGGDYRKNKTMGDARNDYPRLCWGCLAIIEDYAHDEALCTYGGYCIGCHTSGIEDMPGLREALQGHCQRMNSIIERNTLLAEVRDKSMAKAGDLTVEVSFEMTERSREVLRSEMRVLLLEILADSEHDLRGYVKSVVRDVLKDEVRKQSMNASPRYVR